MKKFILITVLAFTMLLTACSGNNSQSIASTTETNTTQSTQSTQPAQPAQSSQPAQSAQSSQPTQSSGNSENGEKTFTKAELKKYDGQNGNAAYVAFDGKVYDVTNAEGWKGGQHQGYAAGVDITDYIKASDHGTKVLERLPVVGTYKE